MVAIAYTDINTPAPRPKQVSTKVSRQSANSMPDPVVDMVARLISVPLNQAYALLWRTGLLSVDD